jgi:hypothetical protein
MRQKGHECRIGWLNGRVVKPVVDGGSSISTGRKVWLLSGAFDVSLVAEENRWNFRHLKIRFAFIA